MAGLRAVRPHGQLSAYPKQPYQWGAGHNVLYGGICAAHVHGAHVRCDDAVPLPVCDVPYGSKVPGGAAVSMASGHRAGAAAAEVPEARSLTLQLLTSPDWLSLCLTLRLSLRTACPAHVLRRTRRRVALATVLQRASGCCQQQQAYR